MYNVRTAAVWCALAASLVAVPTIADASSIVVFGVNSNAAVTSFLNANGHTAIDVGSGAPTAAQLVGKDAVINLRGTGNADLATWVLGGGLLITEWQGAEWALDVAELLAADGGSSAFIGTGTPITITPAGVALGLSAGVNNPFADSNRTEFQWTLSGIGAGVDVLATRAGGIPVVIGGTSGLGYTFVNSLDWADSFGSANADTRQFLLNALEVGGDHVPEPASLTLAALSLVALHRARRRSR